MSLLCGHTECQNCGRHAAYELVTMQGDKIPLCPQCALAVVYGELEIMIVETGDKSAELVRDYMEGDDGDAKEKRPRYLN